MSGGMAVRGAIIEALRGDTELGALVNLISDGEKVKASPPWLFVGESSSTAWGASGVSGLTLRQPIQLILRGDDLALVTSVMERVDTVLSNMDGALGDWTITSLRFERSRIMRSRADWRASVDYAVRAARLS